MKDLVIIAASGLAREVAATVEQSDDWNLVGFLDDSPGLVGTSVAGKPVLGGIEAVGDYPDAWMLICAGKGQVRRAIAARLSECGVTGSRFATLIAPNVHVPANCSIGAGSILLSGTVLTADVTVGAHVVMMPGVVLTHDNLVQDYVTLCAQVALGGNVTVGEAAYLGMGALARERLTIGANAVLGMGAVLLNDLPAGQTWAGIPAEPIRLRTKLQEKVS